MGKPEHPHTANWRRAIPSEDPAVARLTAMVTVLTSELAIVRERLDTVERLAERAGVFTRAEVETYAPPPEAVAERDAIRQRQIAKVFRPLRDDVEREARRSARREGR